MFNEIRKVIEFLFTTISDGFNSYQDIKIRLNFCPFNKYIMSCVKLSTASFISIQFKHMPPLNLYKVLEGT